MDSIYKKILSGVVLFFLFLFITDWNAHNWTLDPLFFLKALSNWWVIIYICATPYLLKKDYILIIGVALLSLLLIILSSTGYLVSKEYGSHIRLLVQWIWILGGLILYVYRKSAGKQK